ncbi:TPR/MLP1/MLP2-like protein [Nitzschia inconspicua]|uniref:TPR/MLP1/MLP2-like protein n=1 Tax=Nitzschia inconspicua TaxID=303405 RepID=A0A9K3M3L3_9STRA|nr:TPR/MLP1/MLP2-like protein [Nitzschia inconspicua]
MSESAPPPREDIDGNETGQRTVWEKAGDESNQMVLQSYLEDIESKHMKQQNELIQTRQRAAELDAALKASQNKAEELQQALQAKTEAFDALQLEYQGANSKSLSSEESAKMNQERIDRLQVEEDKLREEISRLTKENNEFKAKVAHAEAQSKLDDSSVLPLQYQVQRLQTEIDTVQTHSNWLEEELRQKSEELSNIKMTHAVEMAQLRGQVDMAMSEKETIEVDRNNLRNAVDGLQKMNGALSREVHEAKQEAIDSKASAEEELVASRRLVDLQKQQLERLQQRYDGMAQQLQSLNVMAQQAERDTEKQWREQERQIQAASKRVLAEQAAEYQKKIADMQEQINEANRRCKKAEDGLLRIEAPPTLRALPSTAMKRMTDEDGDEEPLNLTDLYNRLAEAEDALTAEVTRRTKVEIKFARLEAEIEASAPIFQQQKQECELARERQEEYMKRTENALNDAAAARSEVSMLQAEMSRLRSKNEELTEDAKGLAKQVQEMLLAKTTGVENPTVPQTVAQMQGANQRLLKEYRELQNRYDELEKKLNDDEKAQEIEQYRRQLESLQSDRKRQESLVTSIVQQRDLYRALVMKTDPKMLGSEEENSALEIVKRQSARSNALQEENKKIHNELTQAKAQLESYDRDKEMLSVRLQRYEALNGELSSTVDRLTLEVSSQKAAVARSEADASYHKDKVVRLEESLQRIREEVNQVTLSKNQLMKLNGDLEHAISAANAGASKLDAELRQARSKLHLVEAQAESAKAAEKRISDEAVQLRSELSRQGAMIESIQRIENSLISRNNSEIESYKSEITVLRNKLSEIESRTGTDSEVSKGRIAELELRIQELTDNCTKGAKEALDAKNEAVESLKKMEEATKNAAMLEAQLKAAKKRLGDTSDDQDTEAEITSKLASVTAELESAKTQVEKWKERADTYEKLAKDNETAVAQMREASNDARKGLDQELARLREELQHSNIEMTKRKEVITELTNDLSSQRAEKEKAVNEVRKQVSSLKADVDKYQQAAQAAEDRYNEVYADLNVLRQDLLEVQSNYERELGLHARARSDLRAAREECEKEVRLRKNAEQEFVRIKGELDMQQSLLDVEKSKREEETNALEKKLEDSRAQNNLLHAQLEKINEQIDKMQSGRLEGDSSGEGKVEDLLGNDEMSSLRRTVSELRELVKFVRSEKDAIQDQLDAARRANDRERSKAAVILRNLEEARAELQVAREASNEKTADANALSEKVKSNEEQCRLLNDSNAHLQQQVLGLQKKLSKVTDDLEKAQKALEPAQDLQKELQSDKAALLSEKESLIKEIEDWKNRVQSLVSRFNQIDPEEHKKLAKKTEELEKQVKDLQMKKLDAENETKRIRGLASRASTQLTQNKQLVEDHKKTIAKLTTEKDALIKSQKDVPSQKEVNELKEAMSKLEKEREKEGTLMKSANEMNEKLRDRLRQFQKTIQSLQKDNTDLSDKLSEAQTKLEEQKKSMHSARETGDVRAAKAAASVGQKAPSSTELKPSLSSQPEAEPSIGSTPEAAASAAPLLTKQKDSVVSTQTPIAESSVLKVPPGGFNFGPSEGSISTQPKPPDAATQSIATAPKKQEAYTSQEDLVSKQNLPAPSVMKTSAETNQDKDGTTGSKSVDSPKPSSTTESAASVRRSSGEMKELSMKEKLLERKRKLQDQLKKGKKKEGSLQEGAKSVQQNPEPEAKRSKTDSTDSVSDSASKPTTSPLDPHAKPFVPPIPEEKSTTGAQNVTKDAAEDGKGKQEKGEVESVDVESSQETKAPVNPFVAATTTASVFGSGSGTKPASFGSVFGSGGSAPTFGQTSGFGSATSTGFSSALTPGMSSIFGGSKKPEGEPKQSSDLPSSGSFLNIKPPGSSTVTPHFSFGTSSNIILPTPSTNLSTQGNMFNAFTNPFGGAGASVSSGASTKPLFSTNEEKEESKDVEAGEEEEEEGEMEEESEQK